jgi:hypothetical protein
MENPKDMMWFFFKDFKSAEEENVMSDKSMTAVLNGPYRQ